MESFNRTLRFSILTPMYSAVGKLGGTKRDTGKEAFANECPKSATRSQHYRSQIILAVH